jgi:hydroxyethylthiazole kinase
MTKFPMPQQAGHLLDRVRARRPRVHCLMNTVVQKFVADGLTAIGAIPSMTFSADEIVGFVSKADVLVVNLGTLDADRRKVIHLAVEVANDHGKPWILDPVHSDYSPVRLEFAKTLIARGPTVLRGNSAEMALFGDIGETLKIETGAHDRLTDGTRTVSVRNGHRWMADVTGTGCLSGGIIAAYLAVEQDAMAAAAAALATTGVAAEQAAEHARGPGSFAVAFMDALSSLTADELSLHGRIHNEI